MVDGSDRFKWIERRVPNELLKETTTIVEVEVVLVIELFKVHITSCL